MLGASVLLGAVMVLAVVVFVWQRSGGNSPDHETAGSGSGEESAGETSTTAPRRTTTSTTETEKERLAPHVVPIVPMPCPGDVIKEICDAAEFVQVTRNLAFKTFPTVETLDDDELAAEIADLVAESSAKLEVDQAVLQATGLITDDYVLSEEIPKAYASGVLGFYDPESLRLVVVASEFNLFGQSVLVHELTHALDDQWFDLDREFDDDDVAYGFQAAVEGNASRIEELWKAQLDDGQRSEILRQELASASMEDIKLMLSMPLAIQQMMISPYIDGLKWAQDRAEIGGEKIINEALAVPPNSSEQILNPSLDGDEIEPVMVVAPPAGGEVVDNNTMGEFGIRLWLGRRAAQGWGGDQYSSWWSNDGLACMAVNIAADSGPDHVELVDAATDWVNEDPSNRSVTEHQVRGTDLVLVEGCA